MNKPELGVGIIPIPDGLADNCSSLRISLVLAPSAAMNKTVQLEHWPREIARLVDPVGGTKGARGLVVEFFDKKGGALPKPGALELHPSIRLASAAASAAAAWRDLFPFDSVKNIDQMDVLHQILSDKAKAVPKARVASMQTRHYRAAKIASVIGQVRSGAIGPTLRARLLMQDYKNKVGTLKLSSPIMARVAAMDRAPFRFLFEHTLLNATAPAFDGSAAGSPVFHLGQPNQKSTEFDLRLLHDIVQRTRVDAVLAELNGRAVTASAADRGVMDFLDMPENTRESMIESLLFGTPFQSDYLAFRGKAMRQPERIALRLRFEHAFYAMEFSRAFADVRATQARALEAARRSDPEKCPTDDAYAEGVRAKFTSLPSRPTLAKLLNFVVDIVVPDAAFIPEQGFIRVRFAGETSKAVPLVAYHLIRGTCAQPGQFRPGSVREEYGLAAPPETALLGLPLSAGFVALDAARFKLSSTDIHSLVNATMVNLSARYSARQGGSDNRDISPRMTEERSRGIQLLDEQGLKPTVANLERAAQPSVTVFAENLVTGYRVFVRRTLQSGARRPWCALMARSVTYVPVHSQYRAGHGEAGPTWLPYAEDREREHGATRPLPRIQKPGDAPAGAVAPSHIFTWFGDSLGVPAPHAPERLSCEQSEQERLRIGVGMTYGYPVGKEYILPALRVGSGYEVGIAPVYLHGGGPTLAQATRAFDDTSIGQALVLGSGDSADTPFRFGRAGDVQAPVVLLSPQDRIVTGKPAVRNEHVERIVLRTGGGEDTGQVTRFFAPPRVDFSSAEQYAVFDRDRSSRPEGAFTGYDRDVRGDFASVEPKVTRQGEPEKLYVLRRTGRKSGDAKPYYPDPAARNLSLAFARGEQVPEGFPDIVPALAFWPKKPGDAYTGSLGAKPIRLDFTRWPEARKGGRVDPDAEVLNTGRHLTFQIAPAEEVTLWTWCWPDLAELFRSRPSLRKSLARNLAASGAQVAELWLASNVTRDAAELGQYTAAAASGGMTTTQYVGMKRLDALFLQLASDPDQLLPSKATAALAPLIPVLEQVLFHNLPLNGVTGWRKLEVVHAVVKPRDVPAIAGDRFLPLRLMPGETVGARHQQVQMKKQKPRGTAKAEDGVEALPHSYGGSKLFFTGEICFDRASTRSLRVEANWPMLDYAHAVVDISTDASGKAPHFVDRPPRVDRVLFDITDIPRATGHNREGVLSLLIDEVGRFRELSTQSDNVGAAATAARKMSLRIVATSRFSNDFTPEEPGRGAAELGKFEVESRRYRGPRPPLAALPWERFYEVMVPATVRPPIPVASRIEWVAPEQRRRVSSTHLIVKKRYLPRIYLDKSVRVSGEHELIAIAFLPAGAIKEEKYVDDAQAPDLADGELHPVAGVNAEFSDEFLRFTAKPAGNSLLPKDFCDFGDGSDLCQGQEPARLAMVTRWGADPTTSPMGRMEALISPNRFYGHVAALPSVPMPLPDSLPDAGGVQPSFNVGVLLYKPQLDGHTGEWYIDIGIDPGAAHAPFVRLALTRYQPYALNNDKVDLRMSAPLLLDAMRIPSPRTVEVLHAPGKPIIASVYGVGYVKREPYGVSKAVRHLTDTPLQNIELMRTTDSRPRGLLLAYSSEGKPLREALIQPTLAGPILHWRSQFAPPVTKERQRYALVIDEIDMHIPDEVIDRVALGKPPPDGQIAGKAGDLVARPGFFSLTIDLEADLT